MEREVWQVGLSVFLGIQVEGTREEAQEKVNELAGYVQHTLGEAGIMVARREHIIRAKEEVVDVNDLAEIAAGNGNSEAAG